MFPDTVFLGLDLYWWMMVIGVIASLVGVRLFHRQAGVSSRVFNFTIILLVVSIMLGYVFSVLFESWYEFLETGVFEWGVGATFYGGLIGGAALFLAGYFGIGHFLFKDKRHIREFNRVVSVSLPCVAIAHGIGRLGCLFDGCCYGKVTDSSIGIMMYTDGEWTRRIPTQLFEAIFLMALFAALMALCVKKKCEYTASIYLIAYGVWRFVIEFARDDVRGSSGIPGLTPSQLTAIVLVIVGVAYIFVYKYVLKGVLERAGQSSESSTNNENYASGENTESVESGENIDNTDNIVKSEDEQAQAD